MDTWRLPGYPLLIMLVYVLAGQGNLMAVSIAQAALFVAATLEIYALTILIQGRAWLAFLVGLLVGTNLVLLSYVKPIMSEGLTLWLLTTLALMTVYFIRTTSIRALWCITICLLPLLLTRPEWSYLPILLIAYLLFVAVHPDRLRRLLHHALLSLVVIYAVIGGYIATNALLNHYAGLSAIENFNLMGKVLQYDMQDEVTPDQTQLSRKLDFYVRRIDTDPYHVLPYIPELSRDNDLPAGQFARSIILRHPLEFLARSTPIFFTSLTRYHDSGRVNIPGPFDGPLNWLQSIHQILYNWNICFPFCAAVWLLLLCKRKARANRTIASMGVIALLALYGLIITTLGGYSFTDYMRVHIVFDPLIILTIWGSILMGACLIGKAISSPPG